MRDRLTDEQLAKVVAEATRLSQNNDLDREQIKQVLQELDLSPDLLDDALVQVKRREALAVRRQRMVWIGVGATLVVVGAIALVAGTSFQYQRLLNQVEAVQGRLTLAQDDGGDLQQVSREESPELVYRVTLSDAPVNRQLSLSCQWTTPTGDVVRENRYETQTITTSVWDTYCRHQIGPASAVGTWTVDMYVGDRPISSDRFEVQ